MSGTAWHGKEGRCECNNPVFDCTESDNCRVRRKFKSTELKDPQEAVFTNDRDCEHGRQKGKCCECDLQDAENYIIELEDYTAELTQEVADLKAANGNLAKSLVEAEERNAELAADQCCVSGGLTDDEFGNQHCAMLQLRDAAATRASTYAKMLDSTEQRVADLKSTGHRLALELECLLMDTKDSAIQSRWWNPSIEAIEDWKKLFAYHGPRLGD